MKVRKKPEMTIGYVNPEYGCTRNIVGKCDSCQYVRVRSFKTLGERLRAKLGLLPKGLRPYYFCGGIKESFRHIDLMHFWNNISLFPSRKPYVTTFETTVPRKFPMGKMMEKGIESMLSSRCRKMIALSNHARLRQLQFDKDFRCTELDKKIYVLLPPQDVLVSQPDIEAKWAMHSKGVVRFLFVGRDCFQKGGGELIRAAVTLRKSYPIELYIVGDFSRMTFACSDIIDNYVEIMQTIENNSSWIHVYKELQNSDVLLLARKCHIGCLPTRDDTFGYSVLEFQASGMPCITTDIRALPEINNEEIGWVVKVPKLSNGCADFETKEKLYKLSHSIEEGLIDIMGEILSNSEDIYVKALRACESIRLKHNPQIFSKCLYKIYNEAIG